MNRQMLVVAALLVALVAGTFTSIHFSVIAAQPLAALFDANRDR